MDSIAGTLVSDNTKLYLRDCQDHIAQLHDLVEGYRDAISTLVSLHLSVSSHRMNEAMRVLTVFAARFMPLSFVAGVYGMNFDPQCVPLQYAGAWLGLGVSFGARSDAARSRRHVRFLSAARVAGRVNAASISRRSRAVRPGRRPRIAARPPGPSRLRSRRAPQVRTLARCRSPATVFRRSARPEGR